MSTPNPHQPGHQEGEARKDAAHNRLAVYRESFVRQARRVLLHRLLSAVTATIDDVVARIEPAPPGIDPRWRGAVPKALRGIIRDTGGAKSCRPEAHARRVTVWELADRAAAVAWLAGNPDLTNSDCPTPTTSAPLATSHQLTLF